MTNEAKIMIAIEKVKEEEQIAKKKAERKQARKDAKAKAAAVNVVKHSINDDVDFAEADQNEA